MPLIIPKSRNPQLPDEQHHAGLRILQMDVLDDGGRAAAERYFFGFGTARVQNVTACTVCGPTLIFSSSFFGLMPSYIAM